ncbi:UDP-N-acetylglucosamine--N-acetylmuramyl-(pentapeptide) pyrophosphoryl-undecaprenol N-acetylglucosamine transferase [Planctomycetota bacterium]|nr:UDP-N-acetylglucosamine--N-acetylmuramyl-(pentapeptide) pyrophosphoryl-undecaprenol N-acetylglucosamine transferase [Planctomycetota bacterium]
MAKASGILFCGGGTGGHVWPGLAVAACLRKRGETDLRWVGDPARIEARLVPAAGIALLPWGLSRPRPFSPSWILATIRTALTLWRTMAERPPRAVVALGGYAALLPGLLAPLLRRPLLVMEQNARSGRTNRLLGRFATAIVTQFAEASDGLPEQRVRRLGNPVRPIRCRDRGGSSQLTVLVVGGSLAATTLNDLAVRAAPGLAGVPGLHLVHIAGAADRERLAAAYAAAGVSAEVLDFVADMPALYDRVDLAVTRAGATTVAELCAAGIGALYVPLPWAADDHQTANAAAVARIGGAEILPQATTAPEQLAARIMRYASDRAAVADLGQKAASLAVPGAADAVADLVGRLARGRTSGKAATRAHFRRFGDPRPPSAAERRARARASSAPTPVRPRQDLR